MHPAVALIVTYALGACSFALLAARIRGVDLRAHGSGNPGATNVGRVLGRGWGRAVLALDVAKGLIPVALLSAPLPGLPAWLADADGKVVLVVAAVLGHVFPVHLAFRGGKGVATFVGGCVAFDPVAAGVGVALHVLFKRALGMVSVASLVLAWGVPAARLLEGWAGWGAGDGWGALVGLALLITARHADNLRRIRAGTEDRYHGRPDPNEQGGPS